MIIHTQRKVGCPLKQTHDGGRPIPVRRKSGSPLPRHDRVKGASGQTMILCPFDLPTCPFVRAAHRTDCRTLNSKGSHVRSGRIFSVAAWRPRDAHIRSRTWRRARDWRRTGNTVETGGSGGRRPGRTGNPGGRVRGSPGMGRFPVRTPAAPRPRRHPRTWPAS